jgi:hypothetical protein
MSEKNISLLRKRIEKLDDKEFDLEAWKEATMMVLGRIFGETDSSLKQIDNLKIDYSSWALRDATSKYNPAETCKKKGREILSSLIDELEVENEDQGVSVMDIIGKHLKAETIEALKDDPDKGLSLLKKEKKDNLANSIAAILNV